MFKHKSQEAEVKNIIRYLEKAAKNAESVAAAMPGALGEKYTQAADSINEWRDFVVAAEPSASGFEQALAADKAAKEAAKEAAQTEPEEAPNEGQEAAE